MLCREERTALDYIPAPTLFQRGVHDPAQTQRARRLSEPLTVAQIDSGDLYGGRAHTASRRREVIAQAPDSPLGACEEFRVRPQSCPAVNSSKRRNPEVMSYKLHTIISYVYHSYDCHIHPKFLECKVLLFLCIPLILSHTSNVECCYSTDIQ